MGKILKKRRCKRPSGVPVINPMAEEGKARTSGLNAYPQLPTTRPPTAPGVHPEAASKYRRHCRSASLRRQRGAQRARACGAARRHCGERAAVPHFRAPPFSLVPSSACPLSLAPLTSLWGSDAAVRVRRGCANPPFSRALLALPPRRLLQSGVPAHSSMRKADCARVAAELAVGSCPPSPW